VDWAMKETEKRPKKLKKKRSKRATGSSAKTQSRNKRHLPTSKVKANGRASRSINAAKDELAGLKRQVREKIVQGKMLSDNGAESDLEARAVQMRIADLEAKAERAKKSDASHLPVESQKMQARMRALKRRMSET
jgi:hypothetical protein